MAYYICDVIALKRYTKAKNMTTTSITIGTNRNPSKYLHAATLELVSYEHEYSYEGVKIENPTPEQKMLCSIFGGCTSKEVRKEIGFITYRTTSEMNTNFFQMCKDLGFDSSDVQIKKTA